MRSEKSEKIVTIALALTFTSMVSKKKTTLKIFPSLIRLAGKLNQDFVLAENFNTSPLMKWKQREWFFE